MTLKHPNKIKPNKCKNHEYLSSKSQTKPASQHAVQHYKNTVKHHNQPNHTNKVNTINNNTTNQQIQHKHTQFKYKVNINKTQNSKQTTQQTTQNK